MQQRFYRFARSFWWILQMSMALGALFSIIVAGGMAYKMMVKNEPIDVFKIMKVLGIAIVMCFWYPPSMSGFKGASNACILDALAYIPNCIGSYTHDLYEAEATQVSDKYNELMPLIQKRDKLCDSISSPIKSAAGELQMCKHQMFKLKQQELKVFQKDFQKQKRRNKVHLCRFNDRSGQSCHVLCLGHLPNWLVEHDFLSADTVRNAHDIRTDSMGIQRPTKWEGAWAKWITRYLTVHFYGAMLYFVGFYVLLLFDIVLSVQVENLTAITQGEGAMAAYIQNAFMTCGYLLAASVVALKCLNLVPDLAAWMIPEGDTAFSTRNFGEGVASSVKASAASVMKI